MLFKLSSFSVRVTSGQILGDDVTEGGGSRPRPTEVSLTWLKGCHGRARTHTHRAS